MITTSLLRGRPGFWPGHGGFSGSTGGFTLIEVVVAIALLSFGLLALQALGIGAARSIAIADRQSRYVTLASDSLESALYRLRRREIPDQFCQHDLLHGDRMSRSIDLSEPGLARVTIQVLPNPESPHPPAAFELTSAVYLPEPLSGVAQGEVCG